MVPILDGNSEYIATCVKENRSLKNKIKKIKATAVNLNKCLKQIKLPSARAHLLMSYHLIKIPWVTGSRGFLLDEYFL